MTETTAKDSTSEAYQETDSIEQACGCPDTFPDWDDKDIDLSNHCVLSQGIPTFFHMPLSYNTYQKKQATEIDNQELTEKWPGFIMTKMGMLRGRVMRLLEDSQSPGRHIEYLPRPFMVRGKLHPGDVGTVKTSLGEMQMQMVADGLRPKELYLCYITCPRCEEQKGGPKILLARRWLESSGLKRQAAKRTNKKL
ncbi:hypothetical protein MNBD_GAMMA16-2152 [hydrothermal vent metagenome]|uniref:Uncharacterized protein n=1 Tax=hydrothermal vent metagenome TaxID=652676 RepID=A0A3B0ZYS8_9ZZZZ